ncbi:MAG: hypothetical protein ACREJN_16300 [Nitrospiraceae bacterium]
MPLPRHSMTLGERTTQFTLQVSLQAKDAATVRHAVARELRPLPAQLRRLRTYAKVPNCGSIASSPNKPRYESMLRIHILPGSGGQTRTRMACYASFSQGHSV